MLEVKKNGLLRLLLCGDVSGEPGRAAIRRYVPALRRRAGIDFVILNVDNSADGLGITPEIAVEFFDCEADLLTGGNHLFHREEIEPFIVTEKRLLRPLNLDKSIGNGIYEIITKDGVKILVVHLLGQKHMPPSLTSGDPFDCMHRLLDKYVLGKTVDVIVVDFHAEQTTEKNAFANFLDGRVSVVVGTHTHIPTADGRILPGGTAYQTDIGMCGDYDSVIGMEKNSCIALFTKSASCSDIKSACGEATLSGVIVDVDTRTGLALSLEQILMGGILRPRGEFAE
ncbi:MAG: YmdB family metallophosphoesterase [Holosporaceae bacterium]|jgi:metallophosphoesterase (TIGR00282 family)|nr:YmdB family metallophosphoesterase [Holosporaceae bacterium]